METNLQVGEGKVKGLSLYFTIGSPTSRFSLELDMKLGCRIVLSFISVAILFVDLEKYLRAIKEKVDP